MSIPIRLTARVTANLSEVNVKHYLGLPPALTGGEDRRQEMEFPSLLVIEQKPDGVFLFRFTLDRRCVGDTWHVTVDEAKQQAEFEFGNVLSEWMAVPPEIRDPIAFGLSLSDK